MTVPDPVEAPSLAGEAEPSNSLENRWGDASSWPEVELYTDGACSGNPGPGGWAFVLRDAASGKEMESSGGQADTTNNQMELMAVIRGIETLRRPCRVQLFSDSNYVGQGLSQWMAGWKSRGWKRKEGGRLKPVKNVELWQRLDQLVACHEVRFQHVKGHSGHPENERCDQLAVEASLQVAR